MSRHQYAESAVNADRMARRRAAQDVLPTSRDPSSPIIDRGLQARQRMKRFRYWGLIGIATVGGIAALGASMAVAAPEGRGDGEKTRPAKAGDRSTVKQVEPVSSASKNPAPDGRWTSISVRLSQLDRKASESIDHRISEINEFFTKAKEGAGAFADDVLSIQGKAQFTLSNAEAASRATQQRLHDLFGHSIMPSPNMVYYDPFETFLNVKFQERLIHPDVLEDTAQSARTKYASEVNAEEARLLVDLQIDLPGDGFGPMYVFAPSITNLSIAWKSVLSKSREAAGQDLGALVVQEVASAVISNQVEKRINSATDSTLKKAATGLVIGNEIGNAIGGAAKMAGFNPREKLAAGVREAIGQARDLLVLGEVEQRKFYSQLLILSQDHPDPAVRAAASEAKELMEERCRLGLEFLLRESEARRSDRRRSTLYRVVRGPDAEPEIRASQSFLIEVPAADALKFAKSCIDRYRKGD